jgi:hypothetical protein
VKFLILCVEKRIPVCLDVWHLNKCENLCCQDDVLKDGGKSFDLANYPHMFMVRLAFKSSVTSPPRN